jgi:hypothetical protein
MSIEYKKKYLKYRMKYLNLCKIINGGGKPTQYRSWGINIPNSGPAIGWFNNEENKINIKNKNTDKYTVEYKSSFYNNRYNDTDKVMSISIPISDIRMPFIYPHKYNKNHWVTFEKTDECDQKDGCYTRKGKIIELQINLNVLEDKYYKYKIKDSTLTENTVFIIDETEIKSEINSPPLNTAKYRNGISVTWDDEISYKKYNTLIGVIIKSYKNDQYGPFMYKIQSNKQEYEKEEGRITPYTEPIKPSPSEIIKKDIGTIIHYYKLLLQSMSVKLVVIDINTCLLVHQQKLYILRSGNIVDYNTGRGIRNCTINNMDMTDNTINLAFKSLTTGTMQPIIVTTDNINNIQKIY